MSEFFTREFLSQSAVAVAPQLIGAILQSSINNEITAGEIVEVEAYLEQDDPASHSANGKTIRNASMYQQAGTLYVFRSYGIHLCVNIVTGSANQGEAILIRALKPTIGLEIMQRRRQKVNISQLCNGPGNLTQALGITQELDGIDALNNQVIKLIPAKSHSAERIQTSKRIGITKGLEHHYRFTLLNSPFLSRKA